MTAWTRIKKCWTVIDKVLPAVPIVLLALGVTRYLWCVAIEIPIAPFAEAIRNRLGDAESVCVPLHEAFPGEWDGCCVLGPYNSPAAQARKMNIDGWWRLPLLMEVHDGIDTIAFLRDGAVHKWTRVFGSHLSTMGIENNIVPYTRDSMVVLRRDSGYGSITMYRPGDEFYESLGRNEKR